MIIGYLLQVLGLAIIWKLDGGWDAAGVLLVMLGYDRVRLIRLGRVICRIWNGIDQVRRRIEDLEQK